MPIEDVLRTLLWTAQTPLMCAKALRARCGCQIGCYVAHV